VPSLGLAGQKLGHYKSGCGVNDDEQGHQEATPTEQHGKRELIAIDDAHDRPPAFPGREREEVASKRAANDAAATCAME
jgi:hypothetical protein